MWNSCAKFSRLKKAIERHGLDPLNLNLNEAAKLLRKRGITDTVQNRMAWELIDLLEPPACTMTHCRHFGGQSSPCNCSLERVPGHCPIYRDFKTRQKEQEENPTNLKTKVAYIVKHLTKQMSGYGYERQKEVIEEYCKEHDITIDDLIYAHKQICPTIEGDGSDSDKLSRLLSESELPFSTIIAHHKASNPA